MPSLSSLSVLGRAAVLAREKWSETTGSRPGWGGRVSFVALDPGLSERVVLGVRPHGKQLGLV